VLLEDEMSNHEKPILSQLTLREPTPKDLILLEELFHSDFYKYLNISIKPLHINYNHDFKQSNEFQYIAVDQFDTPYGYVKGYYPTVDNHLWIQLLATLPSKLNMGYGKLIIFLLTETLATTNSQQKIYLTCHLENIIGHKFWESIGFKQIYNIKSTHGLYEADLRSLTCIPNHLRH
jgi:RimJ/RimL family protein N-acetyltransferase